MACESPSASFYCYILRAVNSNRTYIGSTNDPLRRLQQHNGERSGGARSTRGEMWCTVAYVRGFTSRRQALSFEYSWRRCCRRRATVPTSIASHERSLYQRWIALYRLFTLGNASKKWFGDKLIVHVEPKYHSSLQFAWQQAGGSKDHDDFEYLTVQEGF